MKRKLFAITSAGCASLLFLIESVANAAGPIDVPLKGTVLYQDTIVPTGPADSNYANCPLSGMTVGTGTISHLGRVAAVSTACIAPSGGNFNILSSTITVTAANGDKLTGAYSGFFRPTGNGTVYELVNGWLTITGGDGRFRNAAGGGPMTGTEDLATGQGSTSISATISYPH